VFSLFYDVVLVHPSRPLIANSHTDDLTRGGQRLALLNRHAVSRCFGPIQIFDGNSGKSILSLMFRSKRPLRDGMKCGP
jgi:hypothetical protein